MAKVIESQNWQQYVMTMTEPHLELEPLPREISVVADALDRLVSLGVLQHSSYDLKKFLALRKSVRANFEIPWTGITPRMQRLLYAINAIRQPKIMVAVGIFCANTFVSNAGAAVGPGACYEAERLVGIEIKPEEAARARQNMDSIDPERETEIVAEDGVSWLQRFNEPIDILYLDADGAKGEGKSVYLDLLRATEGVMKPGSLVLAHNSINAAADLSTYLKYVRDSGRFRESVNVFTDTEGLEITLL